MRELRNGNNRILQIRLLQLVLFYYYRHYGVSGSFKGIKDKRALSLPLASVFFFISSYVNRMKNLELA